jgi:hypothetical protein
MAVSTEAMILAALLDHLKTLAFTPALEVAEPGRGYPEVGKQKAANYLAVFFLPNQTRQVTIGDDPQQKRGLLQVSVFWRAGVGLIKPLDVAGAIINHFKNQVLFANGIRITIYNEPWAAPPLQEDDRVQIPVSIPFFAFEPEN